MLTKRLAAPYPEQVGAWSETRLRPPERWQCPDCGTRWSLDYSGLLTES